MARVSPAKNEYPLTVSEFGDNDWGTGNNYKDKSSVVRTGNNNQEDGYGRQTDESTLRRRRRRSFEPGSEEYAAYVEKRVFNKRHAWTPYLWERKRFVVCFSLF